MKTSRCKTCTWWDNREKFVSFLPKMDFKPNPGFCRRRKAPAVSYEKILIGVHPVHDADEFCGEYTEEKK
ncbi:MAG: hypothetical protein ACYS0H_17720 [Planctomycetota bacterium]|jgi:hypothetical protein